MKWCLLLNNAPGMGEFLGKLSESIIKAGEECIAVADGQLALYGNRKYFHRNVKFLSMVDWCIKNPEQIQKPIQDLSWKKLFSTYDRSIRWRLFKFDYNKTVAMVSRLYQFLNMVFQEEKPDIVIQEAPANIFTEIAYHFSKKNNITYFSLVGSRIGRRADVYDLKYSCSLYEKDFKKLLNQNIPGEKEGFIQNLIQKFLSHKELPSYVNTKTFKVNKINRIKYLIRRFRKVYKPYLLNRKEFREFDYDSEAVVKSILRIRWQPLINKARAIIQKGFFDSFDNSEIYFLFPLHFEPEASISGQATYFCDQLNTIKNIAFSLPFPYKLYVKEHPAVVGTRPNSFYKELKRIPNVFLISPYENVENLIKKSQGIITLTSTVGLEAVLSGKPVYLLGDVFYSFHPLCRKIQNFNELKRQIEIDRVRDLVPTDLNHINVCFLLSYLRNTIAGSIGIVGSEFENDTNDYQKIYKDIKKIYGQIK